MNNKGLCITCVNNKECNFLRKFPVLYCEEFSDCEPGLLSEEREIIDNQ